MARIDIIGAGIVGLWQALTLARDGHQVRLLERSSEIFADAASRLGGAMLAPYCESEMCEPVVRELGLRALDIWLREDLGVTQAGTLVLALPRDRAELNRFAAMTGAFEWLGPERIAELEPSLEGRYSSGLFYCGEAHIVPAAAAKALIDRLHQAGVEMRLGVDGTAEPGTASDFIIDCRGLAARDALSDLRGVRGEMIVVECREVELTRPVRILHPRFPIYVVPWGQRRYMIGATELESEDRGPVTLRSALDLLGTAYALHPAFGEARIVQLGADARPAFPDNIPRIIVRNNHIHVNGMHRHGYLTAPALAELVAHYIKIGFANSEVIHEHHRQW
jgi:glycine oxidase